MAFPYLPGVTLNLADLGLKIAPPPAGPKVTLLGYTSNTEVPLNEPLTVTNVGKVTNSLYAINSLSVTGAGELALAVEEAIAGGAQNVEVVVINHISGAAYESSIDPASAPGQLARFNDLAVTYDIVKQSQLNIVSPVNAWMDATNETFGKQLADFCHQASKESDSSVHGVIPTMNPLEWAYAYKVPLTIGPGSTAPAALSGEITAITGASDWYFGSPSTALIGEWVKYVTQYNTPATGDLANPIPASTSFINYLAGSEDSTGGFNPLSDQNLDPNLNPLYFSSWQATDTDGSLEVDTKGNKVDAGRRISVFASPLITSTSLIKDHASLHGGPISSTVYNTNGAAGYAGLITSLPPQSAPTNKPLSSVRAMRPISPSQANVLTARRFTTMHNRATGFVVTSAVTGAHNMSKFVRSDFVRLTTIRIVDSVVNIIRSIADQYIGEANTAAARNALSNEVEKFLKNMRVAQALNDFQMFLSATNDQQVLGEATIDLTLVPAFELVKIETNISLAKKL